MLGLVGLLVEERRNDGQHSWSKLVKASNMHHRLVFTHPTGRLAHWIPETASPNNKTATQRMVEGVNVTLATLFSHSGFTHGQAEYSLGRRK